MGHFLQSHLRPLLLLQKNIVRIMTFSTYYAHTDPLFKDLKILTIDKLVVHRIGIAMYKINNGLFPSVLNELYKKNSVIHMIMTQEQKICSVFHLELKPSLR